MSDPKAMFDRASELGAQDRSSQGRGSKAGRGEREARAREEGSVLELAARTHHRHRGDAHQRDCPRCGRSRIFFFSQQVSRSQGKIPTNDIQYSGRRISYSPQFGIEGEPVPDLLQTRFGTYVEPSRFETPTRQHFTFGFPDVKLGLWPALGLVGDQISAF